MNTLQEIFKTAKDTLEEILKSTEGKHWQWHNKNPATAPAAMQGVNHPKDHVAVANNILQQYGGNRFKAMTGANNFMASQEGGGALTFKLPRTNGATKGQ